MLTKTPVADDQIAALPRPLGVVRAATRLDGGMFATVLRADLVDGRRVVAKITGSDTSRLLSDEHGG